MEPFVEDLRQPSLCRGERGFFWSFSELTLSGQRQSESKEKSDGQAKGFSGEVHFVGKFDKPVPVQH